jgi:hypothetical protein
MMRRLIAIAATLGCSTLTLSWPVAACPANDDAIDKIGFDLDQLDELGLYGPDDGKRSLSYEFCVPNDVAAIETVQSIDPTLMIYPQSPGRIGCNETEVLAIGETHQPNYRDVLINLASLDTVDRIEPFWGE